MFKKVILLILLSVSPFLLFAEDVFNDIPGSYVIYNDTRFGTQAYIGLMYLGEDTVLVRTFEKESEYEMVFVANMQVVDGNLEMGDQLQILAGEINGSTTAGRMLPMLLNWANAWYRNREKIDRLSPLVAEADDVYTYQYWIPVFNIEKINDDNLFQIVTAGIVGNINDPAFAMFSGLPEQVHSESFRIIPGNSNSTVNPELNMTLDQNWVEGEDGVFRIQMKTVQDAAVFKEDINLEGTPFQDKYDIAKIMMLSSGGVLLAGESLVYQSGDSLVMENQVYDPNTGAVSFQHKRFEQTDDIVSTVSFASFLDLYTENREYFEELLK